MASYRGYEYRDIDDIFKEMVFQSAAPPSVPRTDFDLKFKDLKEHLRLFLRKHLPAVCDTLRKRSPVWLELNFVGDGGQWRRTKAFFEIAQNILRSMEEKGLAKHLQQSVDWRESRRASGSLRGGGPRRDSSVFLPTLYDQGPQALSDWIGTKPPTPLDLILKALKKNILLFVSEELTALRGILNPSSKAHPQGGHGAKAESSSRLEFFRITEDILRTTMHEEALAHTLHSRLQAAECPQKLKRDLLKKFQHVFEGISKAGSPTPLKHIYTELYLTEGGTGGVNQEHEVRHIEAASRKPATGPRATIRPQDIFKAPTGRHWPIRTVLTMGVAGIGKTLLTHKFALDWAEDKANQDTDFIFPFTFRELNLLKDHKFSLLGLVHHFFPRTEEAGIFNFEDLQVVFILDGLDECRLPLDFRNKDTLTDVGESTSVDVVLTNLIRGKLLPSARLWITTRPAAANGIPPQCVSMVTQVRGFTDPQKEEYFRKRFRDKEQATTVISHIRSSPSLNIMCHIPVFCWISAMVLENTLKSRRRAELPKSLTQMYIHFLLVQTKVKRVKYEGGGAETDPLWGPANRRMMESLGKVAFEQLQKGNLIFYKSNLAECGLDIRAASVCSGVLTQIFREERGLYQDKVFCFVHLSLQEFLAALHVHLSFIHSGVNLLAPQKSSQFFRDKYKLIDLYQNAVDQALRSPSGRLDLFLRFLLGLSQQTNQILLRGLLEQTGSQKTNQKITEFIKERISENRDPPKRVFNLFHCLNELNDGSMVEIRQQLRLGPRSTHTMSPFHWSALSFILLSSQEDLDVFDLRKYAPSEEGLLNLLPVLRASSKAILKDCKLTKKSCGVLARELRSPQCELRELDLSHNALGDSGVKQLAPALTAPCRLERLRLSDCRVTEEGCAALAAALRSPHSRLTELDLTKNRLGPTGEKLLYALLQDSPGKLQTLRFGATPHEELLPAMKKLELSASDWTKVTPKLMDDDEPQTFSLTTGAGRFECSRSGLRWICKATVCFQYQFCSWKEHVSRPSCVDYEPAGPLIDITVTDGTLNQVHLPHWLCMDKHYPTPDMFAVLHVNGIVHVLEKAPEVTEHHVKLLQPQFSMKGVMFLKRLFRTVKVWHDVFIYMTSKAFLTLHVYLLHPDQHLLKEVESRENADGSEAIRKPSSSQPFDMNKNFFLITDQLQAHITPPSMKLRKVKRSTVFFEVFLRGVQDDFTLRLDSGDERQTQDMVWTCTIRTDDYRRGAHALCLTPSSGTHFIDQHRTTLIQSVCDINSILDQLLDSGLMSEEDYERVRKTCTTQDQMRLILRLVGSAGRAGKDALYSILRGMRNLRPLIVKLEGS